MAETVSDPDYNECMVVSDWICIGVISTITNIVWKMVIVVHITMALLSIAIYEYSSIVIHNIIHGKAYGDSSSM